MSGAGRLSIGGVVIALVLSLVFGKDFLSGLQGGGATSMVPGDSQPLQTTPEEEKLVDFVSFVLDNAQATWREVLPAQGVTYRDTRLVLYRDGVDSACGFGQSASGPFYCPSDENVYLDLNFYEALDKRFGAPGDFAQAYVLAHEIGHHVQHILGTDARVQNAAGGASANEMSVRLELQADCFAGIWGHSASGKNLLESGDAAEGMGAAASIGDDRLQGQSGQVRPESFTHGTSEQRVTWLRRGLASGRMADCDTFRQ